MGIIIWIKLFSEIYINYIIKLKFIFQGTLKQVNQSKFMIKSNIYLLKSKHNSNSQ